MLKYGHLPCPVKLVTYWIPVGSEIRKCVSADPMWTFDLRNVLLRWLKRGSGGDPAGTNHALGANNLQTLGDGPHPHDMC